MDNSDLVVCIGCGCPTPAEVIHDDHDPDCPRRNPEAEGSSCWCSRPCCPSCCTSCNPPPEWSLLIHSWAGVTPGASHYYGSITRTDDGAPEDRTIRHEVRREITPEIAAEMGEDYGYRVGGSTIRFDDREDLVAHAVALWTELGLGGQLLMGSPVYDNRRVLAGPDQP